MGNNSLGFPSLISVTTGVERPGGGSGLGGDLGAVAWLSLKTNTESRNVMHGRSGIVIKSPGWTLRGVENTANPTFNYHKGLFKSCFCISVENASQCRSVLFMTWWSSGSFFICIYMYSLQDTSVNSYSRISFFLRYFHAHLVAFSTGRFYFISCFIECICIFDWTLQTTCFLYRSMEKLKQSAVSAIKHFLLLKSVRPLLERHNTFSYYPVKTSHVFTRFRDCCSKTLFMAFPITMLWISCCVGKIKSRTISTFSSV